MLCCLLNTNLTTYLTLYFWLLRFKIEGFGRSKIGLNFLTKLGQVRLSLNTTRFKLKITGQVSLVTGTSGMLICHRTSQLCYQYYASI